MRARPYGDEALLLQPDDAAEVLGLAAALRGRPGVPEVVTAARTVLGRGETPAIERLRADAGVRVVEPGAAATGEEVVLDVRYDGPDLRTTAADLRIEGA